MGLSIHTPVSMRLYILHPRQYLILSIFLSWFILWAFNGVPLWFYLHFLMINEDQYLFVCFLEICCLLKFLLLSSSFFCGLSFFFICSSLYIHLWVANTFHSTAFSSWMVSLRIRSFSFYVIHFIIVFLHDRAFWVLLKKSFHIPRFWRYSTK